MSITISENPSVEGFKGSWANMVEAIEPDIDSLPSHWKNVFEGPIKMLISSKISLSIFPKRFLKPIVNKTYYIYSLLKYPDFVDYSLEYLAVEIGELLSFLGLCMSVDGKFVLEGPMSRHFSQQTQRLLSVDSKGKTRDISGGYYGQ